MEANGFNGDTTLDLSLETSRSFIWNDFSYTSISCPVSLYKVTCTDPTSKTIELDGFGIQTGDNTSFCSDFVINTDANSRSIDVLGITDGGTIDSYYEGVYQLQVEGYSLDHSEIATLSIEFTIYADCSDSNSQIYIPTAHTFDCVDSGDPTGAKVAYDDIHHYLRTDETFDVPLFTTVFSFTCAIEYELVDTSGTSLPSYMSFTTDTT